MPIKITSTIEDGQDKELEAIDIVERVFNILRFNDSQKVRISKFIAGRMEEQSNAKSS